MVDGNENNVLHYLPVYKTQKRILFTSVHDFPKQIFASQKVFRRTIPTSVPELMLTLLQCHVHATTDGLQHARIFANHSSLFVAQ